MLGVKQNGKKFEIQGVDNMEKLEQDFFSAIQSNKFNTQLFPRPLKHNIDGKNILMFYVPEVEAKPVYYNNPLNTFIRMGSGDQRALISCRIYPSCVFSRQHKTKVYNIS